MKKFNAVSIFISFIVFSFMVLSCGNQAAKAGKGVLDTYTGNVKINGQPASVGMEVADGAEITTAGGAWCDIVFPGKNIIRVYENAAVIVTLDSSDKQIILKSGNIANVLYSLKDYKDGFKVETSSAVVIVRGTVFYAASESSTNSYICCCNGNIDVKEIKGGKINTMSASHHKGLRVYPSGATNAGMDFHTDQDLDEIAKKLNLVIDWTKVGGLHE
jgi:ferric-dicitrate binding protein FerR (iron transport regulator)